MTRQYQKGMAQSLTAVRVSVGENIGFLERDRTKLRHSQAKSLVFVCVLTSLVHLCMHTRLPLFSLSNRYVDPGQSVSSLITELTGIDDGLLSTHSAKPFPEVHPFLL